MKQSDYDRSMAFGLQVFGQGELAIFFDVFVILILFSTGFWIVDGGKEFKSHFNVTFDSTKESGVTATVGDHEIKWLKYTTGIGVPILYWGLLTYFTNGPHARGNGSRAFALSPTTHDRDSAVAIHRTCAGIFLFLRSKRVSVSSNILYPYQSQGHARPACGNGRHLRS